MAMQLTIGGTEPNKRRYANFAREVFGEGDPAFKAALLPLQEKLFAEVQRVKKELAEAAPKYEHDQNGLQRLVDEKQAEVALWYHAEQATIREGIETKLKKAAEDWKAKREPLRELLNRQRYGDLYGSMSKAELEDAVSFGSDGNLCDLLKNPHDPDEIDVALQAAKKHMVGPEILNAFKKYVADHHLSEPWLHEGENPTLLKFHKLMNAEYGKARVLAEGGMADADIFGPEGLFDESPIDKPVAEENDL